MHLMCNMDDQKLHTCVLEAILKFTTWSTAITHNGMMEQSEQTPSLLRHYRYLGLSR